MKKTFKIILTFFVILIVLIIVLAGVFTYIYTRPVTLTGLEYAKEYTNDFQDYVCYKEDEFGDYNQIEYQVRDQKGLFRNVGSMYRVSYSKEKYNEQIKVINNLDYLDAPVKDDTGDYYLMPAEKVEYNGWTIRVINADENSVYPKNFKMIGTNDNTNTILYMCFTDNDLDIIGENEGEQQLQEFIEEHFDFHFD